MTIIKVSYDGHLKEVELLPCPFCGGEPKCDGLPRGVMGAIYCADENCFGPRTTAMTKADSVEQWHRRPAAATAAAITSIPAHLYWLIGKGRTRPSEPLYAVQLIDPESGIAIIETEAENLADAINAAVKKLGAR